MNSFDPSLPAPLLRRNDRTAKTVIWIVSIVIFLVIASLSRIKFNIPVGFNTRYFALANAILNSGVAVLLIAGIVAVRRAKYQLHRRFMVIAIILSVLFLISYVCHHLTTMDTKFGDINGDGILSLDEKAAVGNFRYFYYFILLTHIPLAGIILPFILFTSYRALSGNYERHKKIARITFPLWLYVAVTGVTIYILVSPYYT